MSYQDEFDQAKIQQYNDHQLQIPEDFQDYLQVMVMGAKKHGANNWLQANTPRASFLGFHNAMFHHLARSFAGMRQDKESTLDHLLHLTTNSQMLYTLIKRGIIKNEEA